MRQNAICHLNAYHGRELEKAYKTSENLKEFQEQEIPEELDPTTDGVQFEELNIEVFKATIKEKVIERLDDENFGYPDAREEIATKITDLMVDEGMDYEESKETVSRGTREEGGITPGDTRENGMY